MQLNYIFVLFFGWKVLFHPFYISLTEIRYNPTSQTLEISQKIFWDDLEIALGDVYDAQVDFLKPADKKALEKMAENYLLSNNQILINGKKINLSYLGYEIEEEAVWFYLESEKIPNPKNVEIKNDILLKHFEGQQNIVNFYKEKKPKSLILYKGKERGTLTFN